MTKALGIKTLDDWYKVSIKDISKVGGVTLINEYGSTFEMLIRMYPGSENSPKHSLNIRAHLVAMEIPATSKRLLQFTRKSDKQTNKTKLKIQRKFMEWMCKERKMQSYADWYQESANSVVKLGGERIMKFYNFSLPDALMSLFPGLFCLCSWGNHLRV